MARTSDARNSHVLPLAITAKTTVRAGDSSDLNTDSRGTVAGDTRTEDEMRAKPKLVVGAAHIFYDEDTKRARTIPKALWPIVRRKLSYVHAAATLTDLRIPPGNRLEALKGLLAGRHSIRVNDQYRITFRFDAGHAWEVRCEDYHS